MKKRPKVFVGVSGGVDSSVALALLKKKGFDVFGVFLKVWHPDFLPCSWKEERRSAMRVCATLEVPFLTLDCEKEYKESVVDYMIREYKNGRVPNPDVFCNKYIKFGIFLNKAKKMGADFVATGHYARVLESLILNSQSSKKEKKYELWESKDKNKDQSYFLYTLNQEQLSHTIFPVGDMTKSEVRRIAKKFSLPTATKKDSQGLCFIGKVDMKEFLSHYIKEKEGDVVNLKGEIVGRHKGVMFYTIGQRHGFTIDKKTTRDPRFFVLSKDIKKNRLIVANKEKEKDKIISIKKINLSSVHFITENEPVFPMNISVRIRYRQEKQQCVLSKDGGMYSISFSRPQEGIAIGQSAVFYKGEICLGGGIIEKTY